MEYSCFVISPIGQPNTEVRQKADMLFKYVIKPAMAVFPEFKTMRADHKYEVASIVESMISDLQQSELCIINMTDLNPNVMYELGRRHETGKPFILLIEQEQLGRLPFDTATLKTIGYDLSNLESVYHAIEEIQQHVRRLLQDGFETNAKASLPSIAEMLNRMERKIMAIQNSLKSGAQPIGATPGAAAAVLADQKGTPNEKFRFAVKKRDIAMLDQLLPILAGMHDFIRFYDQYATVACSVGSDLAAKLVRENMAQFMEEAPDFRKKYEYLACYVTYCGKKDLENEEMALVKETAAALLNEARTDQESAAIFTQIGRMCYGAYVNDDSQQQFLQEAFAYQMKAAELEPGDASYNYNVATLYKMVGDFEQAEAWIERCLEVGGMKDDSHLKLACQIFQRTEHPRLAEVSEALKQLNYYSWDEIFN